MNRNTRNDMFEYVEKQNTRWLPARVVWTLKLLDVVKLQLRPEQRYGYHRDQFRGR